ncbi:MAG: chloride channel protein [Planctomycetia bacterium]|nr:chloride channel protein [Planctomycetia bacterium]
MFTRNSRAHGTGAFIQAFHDEGGSMSLRESLLKALAVIPVIALGGAVGKEGVVAVFAGAIGSVVADRFGLPPRERRRYLVVGCAAGVGAIFQCPLGGALFATTVLYREPDIDGDSLMPSLLASVVSYSWFMAFGGYGSRLLSNTTHLSFTSPVELPAYLLLGLACAAAAFVFRKFLDFFSWAPREIGCPRWLSQAAAGLLVGGIALAVPHVMDSRYVVLQNALDGAFLRERTVPWATWALLFGAIALARIAASAAQVGTGTAGGLFGPVLFIGGAVGAATGAFLGASFPGTFPEGLREALIPVAMAGMLAASLRVPLAAAVMVMEMTGSYGLIVPLMLTCMTSYLAGRRWGAYDEQATALENSPAHVGEWLVKRLEEMRVGDLVEPPGESFVQAHLTLPQIIASIPAGAQAEFAVVDEGAVVGRITADVLERAVQIVGQEKSIIAGDVMEFGAATLVPDDDLYHAMEEFRKSHTGFLPVVDRGSRRLLGKLTRESVHRALRGHVRERREHMAREHARVIDIVQQSEVDVLLAGLPAEPRRKIERIRVPAEVAGKSLRESDFRRRFGEVIAVVRPTGEVLAPPDPAQVLEPDDDLMIVARARE